MRSLLCVLALLSGLAGAARVELSPGKTVWLGKRQVTLLRLQDSRCPPTANCVWAGELSAALLVVAAPGEPGPRTRFLRLTLPAGPNRGQNELHLVGSPAGEPLRVILSDDFRR
ncbi:hypothetical protein [Deinococcus sp. Leaf326]|uniref:hypothetical protein n=1 Tax=Deinococcus sp. Leaf326 TaxID=1736338 RepID=UPI0006F9678E|nr:hypothetical protein [Deinococcus sp. Leaf326]KQR15611.1 hypothetical protein ASF71_08215 [Deinococcus sp. Leaf326]